MNDRTRQNVKSFLGSMNKQAQQVRQLPAGRALQTQDDNAITYVPQQEQGGSWLGTLAKLGLGAGALGAGAYYGLPWLAKQLQSSGAGGGAQNVALNASEAQRMLQEAQQAGTIPTEALGNLSVIAQQHAAEGGSVRDFVKKVQNQYKDFGLGDRSWLPGFLSQGQGTTPTWYEQTMAHMPIIGNLYPSKAPEELSQAYKELEGFKNRQYLDPEHIAETR